MHTKKESSTAFPPPSPPIHCHLFTPGCWTGFLGTPNANHLPATWKPLTAELQQQVTASRNALAWKGPPSSAHSSALTPESPQLPRGRHSAIPAGPAVPAPLPSLPPAPYRAPRDSPWQRPRSPRSPVPGWEMLRDASLPRCPWASPAERGVSAGMGSAGMGSTGMGSTGMRECQGSAARAHGDAGNTGMGAPGCRKHRDAENTGMKEHRDEGTPG